MVYYLRKKRHIYMKHKYHLYCGYFILKSLVHLGGLDYHVISNSVENLSNFYNSSIQDNNYINSTNENDSLLVNDMANDNLEPDHITGEYDTFKYSKPILIRFYNYLEGKINLVNISKAYKHFQNLNFDRKANRKPYFMSNSRMNLLEKFFFFEKLKSSKLLS